MSCPRALSTATLARLRLLAALVFHHRFYVIGRFVSGNLGNRRRFLRPAQLRDDQRHDEFFLHVGELRRSHHGRRNLRPHRELRDGALDHVGLARLGDSADVVPDPAVANSDDESRQYGRPPIEVFMLHGGVGA